MMNRLVGVAVVIAALLVVHTEALAAPTCRDENGHPVAWWVALKIPNGVRYFYMDASYKNLTYSHHRMSSATTGALAHTLGPAYHPDVGRVMYNDDFPDGRRSSSHAHAKGVFARTETGGFWLIHSVPKFPNENSYDGYKEPASDLKGQSFMCITFTSPYNLETVAYQLLINNVHVYGVRVPSYLTKSNAPYFISISKGEKLTSPIYSVQPFTIGGLNFTSFARGCDHDIPLYENLVAPHYRTALLVESWQNGVGKTPTWCRPDHHYQVANVNSVRADRHNWTETVDHSKWVVSGKLHEAGTRKVICVGDINRQDSQIHRGGGTMCIEGYDKVYQAFRQIVGAADTCPSPAPAPG